jgi:murein L,D-transpeptidase YafK
MDVQIIRVPVLISFGGPELPALRPFTAVGADYGLPGLTRARVADETKREIVKALFSDAGVSFPPAKLLLRGYKSERELEVWASGAPDEPLAHITTYSICAASGELGPKRREGDMQVPEGFYRIQYLWPKSAFYLAMRVGYPNVSDKILGDPRMPGSDIMIHGGCASIGCLAMSDERIQELYVMGAAIQGRAPIHVHLFPTRDRAALRSHPSFSEHAEFWSNLYDGHAMFEASHRIPNVRVHWNGSYRFAEG